MWRCNLIKGVMGLCETAIPRGTAMQVSTKAPNISLGLIYWLILTPLPILNEMPQRLRDKNGKSWENKHVQIQVTKFKKYKSWNPKDQQCCAKKHISELHLNCILVYLVKEILYIYYIVLDVAKKHILIGCEKACILRTAEWHRCRKASSPFMAAWLYPT